MDRMYRYQRHIYDLTRKYYLFGRDTLIRNLDAPRRGSVLEVGCGTGRNMALIAKRFPNCRLYGLDISAEMLASAQAKLAGLGQKGATAPVLRVADATNFSSQQFGTDGFDRIVISYALSMIPDWEAAIDAAIGALKPGGSLHIADFGQQEGLPGFVGTGLKAWLARFHVTPRPDLLKVLRQRADSAGATLEFRSLGRGYAWLATYRRHA
ncbi:class I SAM-dependent methyltransferase [Pararhizobium arenae]|uniref:class I SAM-dependent methyltransferase n=1 Tax=Pararhizobium arenae TaxID=1856850 RepID=UPI00094AE5BE|nr:class I SAM-dependent methyltransferase [Pararhizobium arenae]